jgi:nucleoside phosphorylase
VPEFDPETEEWIERASKQEKPYGHLEDGRGLEFLSATGKIQEGNFRVAQNFSHDGLVKWKIVNSSVRLHRSNPKLRGKFEFGYALWDQKDQKIHDGEPEFEVEVRRSDPGKLYYPVKEATCGFTSQGTGEECGRTLITRNGQIIPEKLESQFYCQRLQKRVPMIDYAIVTVRPEEHKAVLSRFPDRKPSPHKRMLCDISITKVDDEKNVTIALARCLESGQHQARNLAEAIMEELDPKWIFLIGIAGGYPAYEFGLGDVVISSRLIDYSKLSFIEGKTPEFDVSGGPFHPDVEKLLQYLPSIEEKKQLGDWNQDVNIAFKRPTLELPSHPGHKDFYGNRAWRQKVFECLKFREEKESKPLLAMGPTISSEAVIKDTEVAERFRQDARSATDVEMELAAFYYAVVSRGNLPKILCIRGISDIIGYKRQHKWLEYACHTPASFVTALIRSGVFNLIEQR